MSTSGRRHARRGTVLLVAAALATALLAPAAEAARSRTLGLGDMAGRAGRVFVGVCTARSVADDAATGLPATTYTFLVTQPIKGVSGGTTTFRIPGTPEQPLIPGLPVFEVGEEALLLLYPESPAGFSAAMGLDQGRFRIVKRPDGTLRAVNGRANVGLLEDVPADLLERGGLVRTQPRAVTLPALVKTLRALASEERP